MRVDLGAVEVGKAQVEVGRKTAEVGDRGVVGDLGQAAGAGDDGGDGAVVEDPALGKLRQRPAGGGEGFEGLGEFDGFLEGDAGEGFADVEGGAVAVVVAMVAGGKGGGAGEASGKHAAGEGKSDDDGHALGLGAREELLRGLLAEDIEDDLERGETLLGEAKQALVDGLHAGAESAELALGAKAAEPFEDLAAAKNLGRHAMELGEVERVDAEPAQRVLGGGAQTGLGVTVGVEGGGAAEFGGDKDVLAARFAEESPDEGLAPTGAINVGGIEEIDTGVGGGVENGQRGGVVDGAPVGASELPAAEADFGGGEGGPCEGAGSHGEGNDVGFGRAEAMPGAEIAQKPGSRQKAVFAAPRFCRRFGMRRFRVLRMLFSLGSVVPLAGEAAGAEARVWTATDGRTLNGEWLETGEKAVKVRREDGQVFDIPLDTLSEPDRAWAVEQGKAKAVETPAVPVALPKERSDAEKRAASEAASEAARRAPFLKGPLVYRLSKGAEKWPEDRRRMIVEAMDAAVAFLNEHGKFKKTVTANNSPGTPTADANWDGWINWGGSINRRVALHEIAHTLGVGTHSRWRENIKDGKWTGKHALRQLREFDGAEAVLYADKMHFWPYGLNFDKESSPENDLRFVKMVAALRKDMEIE